MNFLFIVLEIITIAVSNQAETPNSESDSYFMDYSSLENGMPQKSYGRDAKVSPFSGNTLAKFNVYYES